MEQGSGGGGSSSIQFCEQMIHQKNFFFVYYLAKLQQSSRNLDLDDREESECVVLRANER